MLKVLVPHVPLNSSFFIVNSSFRNNSAIPDKDKYNEGLGGAIYVNSTNTNIENNEFYYNTARNGSAVYLDKFSEKSIFVNNTMYQNQAWVYALPIFANDIYYGDSEEIKKASVELQKFLTKKL